MIEVERLCMQFGPTVALDNVSFSVGRGEIVGLLGPNGAGKTTTMRILATHIMPMSGSAKIGEFNVLKNPMEVRSILGYLPENAPLYPEMEVKEREDIWEELSTIARMNSWNIKEIHERSISLEDVFLSLVDKERIEG